MARYPVKLGRRFGRGHPLKQVIGHYELNPFPGCNQLVVSNHAFIMPEYRGKGHGEASHRHRLAKIKKLGYNCAICTVVSTNEAQKKILSNNLWTMVFSFKNTETDNLVEIWVRDIE